MVEAYSQTDIRIADALERLADKFCPRRKEPCRYWHVWFETTDKNGALSYTYRMGAYECDTGIEAIRQATKSLPEFDEGIRIHRATAARTDAVTEADAYQFHRTPQFHTTV